MGRDESSTGTSSSTPPDGGPPRGVRVEQPPRIPPAVRRLIEEDRAKTPQPPADSMAALQGAANAALVRMSREAMAHGSQLGALKYLRGQILALGAQLDGVIERIERGEVPNVALPPPAEAAT
jgi:hypothetical protein